jgi:ABC-2 type transport system permease protein/capsular polysaccharide transport system permease protein
MTMAAQPPLGEALAIQRRVVFALLMREVLTRYGRHNIGFLWLFVEPMLFTVGVTVLWSLTKTLHGSTIPITAFALTGYSSVLLWRNMPGRCINAVEPNRSLFYHRNVRLTDIFAARLLLELGGASISFMLLALLFWGIDLLDPPEDLLMVMAGWGMLAWFGMALAVLLGTLALRSDLVEKLWHPLSYLTFPLSGAAFMVDALPREVQDMALYLPMVDAVEMIRDGYFGSYAHAHYDAAYLLAVTLMLTLVALALLMASRQLVTVDG